MNIKDAKTMRRNANQINGKIKSEFIKEIELDIEEGLESGYENGDYSMGMLYPKITTKLLNGISPEIEVLKKELILLGYEVSTVRLGTGEDGIEDFRINISW